jgi:hypothetical protein
VIKSPSKSVKWVKIIGNVLLCIWIFMIFSNI